MRMSRTDRLRNELDRQTRLLEEYEDARMRIIATGQSYSLRNGDDQRQVTNVSLSELNTLIERTRRRIGVLENQIASGGMTGNVCAVGARWS